jgi:4-hydroxy-4-methyl-2-oxoglutarate aldolase
MPTSPTTITARLSSMDTATLYESGATNTMSTDIRMLSGTGRVAGTALTVLCHPGDNLMIHAGVAAAKEGDVLVVQCNDPGFGVWGEVLTVAAQARKIAALVVDGSVRDLGAVRDLGFPVFARGTRLKGTVKDTLGALNVPMACGGSLVWPGDYVVADESGIVVIRPDAAEQIAERGEERVRKEADMMAKLRAGKTTVELLNLAGRLS